MKLAARRLENVGWVVLVFGIAIMLYPLSLSVASLRADIVKKDREIVRVQRQIRYLETEFSARASHHQLESWNEMEFGYSAPRPDQFLSGERALAGLGAPEQGRKRMTLVASMGDVKPAGIIGSVFGTAETAKPDKSTAQKSDAEAAAASSELAAMTQTERVAKLEEMLLEDEVLNAEDALAGQAGSKETNL